MITKQYISIDFSYKSQKLIWFMAKKAWI